MFRVFDGHTADDVWQTIASVFRTGDTGAEQPSRAGMTREILHAAIAIRDPRQRWVPSRHPPINPAFAIAEIVWIMTGRNDSAFLNYFNRQLPGYAGCGPAYHGAYGFRLRRHLGIDQLTRAYQGLSHNPHSRQIVLQLWDSAIDLPEIDGEAADPDIPCNIVSMLKVRNGTLEWTQILRSNDVHLGLPYNLVQFTTLQEVMAGWLDLELGTYNQLSDSLHAYTESLQDIHDSLCVQVAPNTDSLALPKEASELAFDQLGRQIDRIITCDLAADELAAIPSRSAVPEAFQNMLRVICAEGARRRGRPDVAKDIMADCTNGAYRQLYDRWLRRVCRLLGTGV